MVTPAVMIALFLSRSVSFIGRWGWNYEIVIVHEHAHK